MQQWSAKAESGLSQYGSQDITIHIGFGMHVAKTATYPVLCPLPLFVALCDHSQPTLQRRQTEE